MAKIYSKGWTEREGTWLPEVRKIGYVSHRTGSSPGTWASILGLNSGSGFQAAGHTDTPQE